VHSLPSSTESSPASLASYGYNNFALGLAALSAGGGIGALTYAAGGGATMRFFRAEFEAAGAAAGVAAKVIGGVVVGRGELL
jgi:hypothetical protein